MGTTPSLVPEVGPDGIPGDVPIIAYTEKLLEEKELQLKQYIQENYSKIRDVERELANLTLELKLTAGPKKAALEHLRKKIEQSTEKIRVAKQKEEQARKVASTFDLRSAQGKSNVVSSPSRHNHVPFSQVWEAAMKVLKEEEANKQKICEDLNRLVQDNASAQYSRLEELKRRLEALNPQPQGVASESIDAHCSSLSSTSSEYSAMGRSNLDNIRMGTMAPDNPVISIGTLSQQTSNGSGNVASSISVNLPSLRDQSPSSKPAILSQDKKGVNKSQRDGRGPSANAVAEGQPDTITKGRSHNVGRGKTAVSLLQKARGEAASGWTGAGFDTDGRA